MRGGLAAIDLLNERFDEFGELLEVGIGKPGSYWSQLLGEAICGPLTGDTLDLLPATVTTWSGWTDRYPDTDVLQPPPRSGAFNPPYPRNGPPGITEG